MGKVILMSAEKYIGKEFVKEFDKSNPKILFITSGANFKKGDKSWVQEMIDSFSNVGCEITPYELEEKSIEEFKVDILQKEFDGIHFGGGDPLYLLEQIRLTEFDRLLKEVEDKVIISGASAGAIVLTHSIESSLVWEGKRETSLPTLEGLGYTHFEILPHMGQERDVENQRNCLKDSAKLSQNGIYLNDHSLIIVEKNKIEIKSFK